MEKLAIGKTVIHKQSAAEYGKCWECDAQAEFGANIKTVIWAAQYDENGDEVAMTTECMLEYEDGSFGYTSRFVVVRDCAMLKALTIMLASMEGF